MSKKDKEALPVEIFKRINHLKMKLGRKDDKPGFIDPEVIEEADQLIEDACGECFELIGEHLEELSHLWKEAKGIEDAHMRKKFSEDIFTLAHEIKDIGVMSKCLLIAYFAESLRDYIGQTEINLDAQHVIVQAHLDAMLAAYKDNITEEDGAVAEELKALVKVAIEKYS